MQNMLSANDTANYHCLARFLFYTVNGTIYSPEPDYTRQAVTLIYAFRVSFSLVFCGYITHYMLQLKTDKLSAGIGWLFTFRLYLQFVRDTVAFSAIQDHEFRDILYVPEIAGRLLRFCFFSLIVALCAQWIDLALLIRASREISRGATVDLQREGFNRSERVLKKALLATIALLFAMIVAETTIDLLDCAGETFEILTEVLHYILLATTLGVGAFFTLVAKKQTSDSWSQARMYNLFIIANIVVSIIVR